MKRINASDYEFRFNNQSGPKYLLRGPNIEFGLVRLLPGESFPDHYHNHIEENFYILEGEMEFKVNDEVFTAGPGELIHAEPKDSHFLKNVGEIPALAVFVKAPYNPTDKVNIDS